MMRKLSIRRRVERLEAARQKQTDATGREAFIVMGDFTGERHLKMAGSADEVRCCFQEMPGPGPQLANFGEFALVVHLTRAEADM